MPRGMSPPLLSTEGSSQQSTCPLLSVHPSVPAGASLGSALCLMALLTCLTRADLYQLFLRPRSKYTGYGALQVT